MIDKKCLLLFSRFKDNSPLFSEEALAFFDPQIEN